MEQSIIFMPCALFDLTKPEASKALLPFQQPSTVCGTIDNLRKGAKHEVKTIL